MVRLSNVGGGLFAEILPMDYRRKFFEKNLYELEYIPKLPMIEGKEI